MEKNLSANHTASSVGNGSISDQDIADPQLEMIKSQNLAMELISKLGSDQNEIIDNALNFM